MDNLNILVFYENQGKCFLGLTKGKKNGKVLIKNSKGQDLRLGENRLYIISDKAKSSDLDLANLLEKASQISKDIDLQFLWSSLNENREYTDVELCSTYFSEESELNLIALRSELITNGIYFKRSKKGFFPRTKEAIEELKIARKKEKESDAMRAKILDMFISSVKNNTKIITKDLEEPLLKKIEDIKYFASFNPKLDQSKRKQVLKLLADLEQREFFPENINQPEKKAYYILFSSGLLGEYEDLTTYKNSIPQFFSEKVLSDADSINYDSEADSDETDLSNLETITIDDITTLDMDDALSLERSEKGYNLYVHISNVAKYINKDSIVDKAAKRRMSSVYSLSDVFNMLPNKLSNEKISLIAGEARSCITFKFELDNSYSIQNCDIFPSFVKVTKKYNYDEVDNALENQSDNTLNLLYEIAGNFEARRIANGSVKVQKNDVQAYLKNNRIHLKTIEEQAPSRSMVGEFMILSNEYAGKFFVENKIPAVFRSQDPPIDVSEKLEGLPAGLAFDFIQRTALRPSSTSTNPKPHSNLGLEVYCQVTSPIRRYLDLVCQRQIYKHLIKQDLLYTRDDIEKLIELSRPTLKNVILCSREKKRFMLLHYLKQRAKTKDTIQATVLRNEAKKAQVEIHEIYMPTLVKLPKEKKAGDVITLKIGRVWPVFDEIDFAIS